MIDNISGLRLFVVATQPDGSIALQMEKQYSADVYYLDLDQAVKLGNALVEMAAGNGGERNL